VHDPTAPVTPTTSALILHGKTRGGPVPRRQPVPGTDLPNALDLRGLDLATWNDYLPVFLSAPEAEALWKEALGLGKVASTVPKNLGYYPPELDDVGAASGSRGAVVHGYGGHEHTWPTPNSKATAELVWRFFADPTSVL
jgi:hypothetical protein